MRNRKGCIWYHSGDILAEHDDFSIENPEGWLSYCEMYTWTGGGFKNQLRSLEQHQSYDHPAHSFISVCQIWWRWMCNKCRICRYTQKIINALSVRPALSSFVWPKVLDRQKLPRYRYCFVEKMKVLSKDISEVKFLKMETSKIWWNVKKKKVKATLACSRLFRRGEQIWWEVGEAPW